MMTKSNSKNTKNKKSSSSYSKIQELESSLEDKTFDQEKIVPGNSSSVSIKKKTLGIVLVLSMLLVISGLWVVYYATSKNNTSQLNEPSSDVKVEQVEYSISGKTIEQDKKDALSSAQLILEEASKSPDGLSPEERVEALEDGDNSVVSDDLKNKMRFKDDFESDPSLQNTTYQALIILSSYLEEEDFNPVNEEVWQEVYLDQEIGVAYVPISAFYSPGASFSLELVYTDGEWKLSPYSLLNIINLSATIQQQQNGESIVPSVPTE